jgi:hypothetical protein
MWVYAQKSGELTHDGAFEGTGYSGTGGARNNPDAQQIAATGPIPQGVYDIGTACDHKRLGRCAMPLYPEKTDAMFGRMGFFIHGDNAIHDASHGCIILGPAIRHLIAASPDRKLTVIEGDKA